MNAEVQSKTKKRHKTLKPLEHFFVLSLCVFAFILSVFSLINQQTMIQALHSTGVENEEQHECSFITDLLHYFEVYVFVLNT